jgi:hypothetical protein
MELMSAPQTCMSGDDRLEPDGRGGLRGTSWPDPV